MNGSRLASLVNFLVACGDSSVADIIHDRVVEQHGILRNNTNLVAEAMNMLLAATNDPIMSEPLHIPVKSNITQIVPIN